MSYPQDLDDYTLEQLEQAVAERMKSHAAGICTYCNRPHGKLPFCQYDRRHMGLEA